MGLLKDRTPLARRTGRPSSDLAAAAQARASGDFPTALSLYDALLTAKPGRADALAGRGACLRALGRPQQALVALLEALSHDPSLLDARLELALALRESGRRDEARTLYGLLLRGPDAPAEAWHGLARLCLGDGADSTAEACLRRAIALAPDTVGVRLDLAEILGRRGNLAGACDLYHDVLAIQPDAAAAHVGLGQALIGMDRFDEAMDQLERALVTQPAAVSAHLARARLHLLKGDLPAAWDDLDWRWSVPGLKRPEPPGSPWDGNAELTGHTILLWAEAGMGEIIHLLRFVTRVADRGATVLLGVPSPLAPLAQGLAGVSRILVSGQPIPAGLVIDYHASLADLPRLLGTELASIPQAPYLDVPPDRRPAIQAPATALVKIGLIWAGARAGGSIPLAQMLPLLSRPGVAAFGLQTGPRARDLTELLHPALITDLSASITDYADLAGRMAEMDVIITVDGPAAHLAGALGLPVWVLLPQAPDWRWMTERDDSPWYGSARLFRQSRPAVWVEPLQAAALALDHLIQERRSLRQAKAGVHAGPTAAVRAFLTAHLKAGDLVLDVGAGAGDGTHALDAAAHPAGDIRVLAIEARQESAAILADTVAVAGGDDCIEVIARPLAATTGPAVVANKPRRGRTVFTLPPWVHSQTHTTTLDALLAERANLSDRRLVLHLGMAGGEDEILSGLTTLPALVVFHHRPGGSIATRLRQASYRLVCFPTDLAAGPVVDFKDQPGPTLALAKGLSPAEIYGDVSDPASPAAMAHAAATARRLAVEGTRALVEGRLNLAGARFGWALATDPDNVEALSNLAALLRRIGRGDAAAACWRRALQNGAGPSVAANLANILRELGQTVAAENGFVRALAAEPDNPAFIYGYGLLERERGRSREAVALFERAEQLRPGTVPAMELATALLKAGNLARGMAELAHRPAPALAPVNVPAWDGSRLEAHTILVRDEGDAIDTVMLARFIPQVARQGGLVVVECVPETARLLTGLPGVEQVVPRGSALPPVNFSVNLLDIPRLIGTTSRTTPPRDVPYLHVPEGVAPPPLTAGPGLRVGIVWNGRATDRSIPLSALVALAGDPRITLVSLQRGPRTADLDSCDARPFIEDMGSKLTDLADSAAVIASLDLIVAADTAEAHLAGAMGIPVWVLLPTSADWRWVDGRDDSVWYPTMRVFRQSQDGSWGTAMARVCQAAAAMAAGKR